MRKVQISNKSAAQGEGIMNKTTRAVGCSAKVLDDRQNIYTLAKEGNSIAQAHIAEAYLRKEVDFITAEDACHFASSSAASGNSKGAYLTILFYGEGIGVNSNSEQVDAATLRALDLGSQEAAICFGATGLLNRSPDWEDALHRCDTGSALDLVTENISAAIHVLKYDHETQVAVLVAESRRVTQLLRDVIEKKESAERNLNAALCAKSCTIRSLETQVRNLKDEIDHLLNTSVLNREVSDLEEEITRLKDDFELQRLCTEDAEDKCIKVDQENENLRKTIKRDESMLRDHRISFFPVAESMITKMSD